MSERSHLATLVEKLAVARVLCVGDVVLDRFVHGEVERISPEAPIPVLRIDGEKAMLGGAGNVVRNLDALGARVSFVAAVGKDGAGTEIRLLLEGIDATLVEEADRKTPIKTRFMAANQQMLRADSETTDALKAKARDGVLKAAAKAMKDCQAMVLSDYGKGMLAEGMAEELIAVAHQAGKKVIVDPKGRDYGRYRGADLITPNRRELGEATGMPVDGDKDIGLAAKQLIDDFAFPAVLVTRGQEGMTLLEGDGKGTHFKAEAREVFDVSGAGDTVVATLAAALAAGIGLGEAAALANVAAGIVVGKTGTAVAYAADIVGALHHQDLSSAEGKVLLLAPALDRVETWRRKGHRIGFTNGCFDLLHPGHVSLLGQARAACDRLVVGLNSDASTERLKGSGRPVQSEAARAAVLASLASVDLVVLFGDDTPLGLIEAIRPDVLVKGADYARADVVGADLVEGYGGRLHLARVEPGYSTSATIARMAK